jgi:fatty acid desaturase
MTSFWRRFEGPTWLVAATIYGGWIALALWHRYLPLAIALPLGVYLTAWHSSLQHETIHALRRVPRAVRTLLASAPLGIWFPYQWYRREHLRQHATRDITGPRDPESFYHEPEAWSRMSAPLRALYTLNQTFAGRLVLGPALQISRIYASEVRRLLRGDTSQAAVWCGHVALVGGLLWLLGRSGVNPLAYLAFVAYPAASLGLVRSFAEHRYASSLRERTAIVESRSALSLLFLNNNLHAVHHRYPALPWFELPERYRIDRARNLFAEDPPPVPGYRTVARSWMWRPIDSPVAGPSSGRGAFEGPAPRLGNARGRVATRVRAASPPADMA